jgi:hypothetical protein
MKVGGKVWPGGAIAYTRNGFASVELPWRFPQRRKKIMQLTVRVRARGRWRWWRVEVGGAQPNLPVEGA